MDDDAAPNGEKLRTLSNPPEGWEQWVQEAVALHPNSMRDVVGNVMRRSRGHVSPGPVIALARALGVPG